MTHGKELQRHEEYLRGKVLRELMRKWFSNPGVRDTESDVMGG